MEKKKAFVAFLSSVAEILYTNVHFIYAFEFKMISSIVLYMYYVYIIIKTHLDMSLFAEPFPIVCG